MSRPAYKGRGGRLRWPVPCERCGVPAGRSCIPDGASAANYTADHAVRRRAIAEYRRTLPLTFTYGSAATRSRVLNASRPGDGAVGALHFEVHDDGHLEVLTVEVPEEFRRQGIASGLMRRLEADHAGTPIDHGVRSPLGERWAAGYYGTPVTAREGACTGDPDDVDGPHPDGDEDGCPQHRPVRAGWTLDGEPYRPPCTRKGCGRPWAEHDHGTFCP